MTESKLCFTVQGKENTLLGHLDDLNTKPHFPLTQTFQPNWFGIGQVTALQPLHISLVPQGRAVSLANIVQIFWSGSC